MLSIAQLGKFFEVKNNWQRMRCRPEVMTFAWLYGKKVANNMEYCLENAGKQIKQSNIVAPTINAINDGYNDLNTKINKATTDVTALKTTINGSGLSMNNINKNLATNLQENILRFKEGMQKVIAGLVIQNQISNGVLKTTSSTKTLTDSLNAALKNIPATTVAK
jgi:hypothetical protein